MPTWKKNIFMRAIRTRMELENRAAAEIILEYTALTEAERAEILNSL